MGMSLKERMDNLQEHIEQETNKFKKDIVDIIGIRQNPDLTIINDSPRCFTIKFSDLSEDSVLSPEFYDFELQNKLISAMVMNSDFDTIYSRLFYIKERGYLPNITIKDKDGNVLKDSNTKIRLHPKVIRCVERAIKDTATEGLED